MMHTTHIHYTQVKRCLRDMQLREIKALFQDVQQLLTQLEVPPGMHHVAWKALASDVKTQTDVVLRKLVRTAAIAAAIVEATQKAYKYPLWLATDSV